MSIRICSISVNRVFSIRQFLRKEDKWNCKTSTRPFWCPNLKNLETKQIKMKRIITNTEIFSYEMLNTKVLAILMFLQFRMSLNNSFLESLSIFTSFYVLTQTFQLATFRSCRLSAFLFFPVSFGTVNPRMWGTMCCIHREKPPTCGSIMFMFCDSCNCLLMYLLSPIT